MDSNPFLDSPRATGRGERERGTEEGTGDGRGNAIGLSVWIAPTARRGGNADQFPPSSSLAPPESARTLSYTDGHVLCTHDV